VRKEAKNMQGNTCQKAGPDKEQEKESLFIVESERTLWIIS